MDMIAPFLQLKAASSVHFIHKFPTLAACVLCASLFSSFVLGLCETLVAFTSTRIGLGSVHAKSPLGLPRARLPYSDLSAFLVAPHGGGPLPHAVGTPPIPTPLTGSRQNQKKGSGCNCCINKSVHGGVNLAPNVVTSCKSTRLGPSARFDLLSTLSMYTRAFTAATLSQ